MRIWSKELIPVLPTKQLKAMRYELGDMIKQYSNIKHPLVKFANNYDICYLGQYFDHVNYELDKRKINHKKSYDDTIYRLVYNKKKISDKYAMFGNCVFNEDNDRYLKQCYYNLEEKYDRGMITQEEWKRIQKMVKI